MLARLIALAMTLCLTFSARAQFQFAADIPLGNGIQAPIINPQGLDSPEFTVEAWVSIRKFQTNHGSVAKYGGSNRPVLWQIYLEELTLGQITVGFEVDGVLARDDRFFIGRHPQWHHIAGTFDGEYIRVYVDGVLRATRYRPGGLPPAGGNRVFSSLTKSHGIIDEIRVWNVARTGDQIRCRMTNTVSMPNAQITAYYQLNDPEGSTYDDRSTFDNDATQPAGATRVNSGAVYLGGGAPPTITIQPVGQSVCAFNSVSFHSEATSIYDVLTYQWYRNGTALVDGPTANGSTIVGSSTTTLSIDTVSTSDAGDYTCVASSICSAQSSTVAALVVSGVSQNAISTSTCVGYSAALHLVVENPALYSFQWRYNRIPITEGRIQGTQTPSLRITNSIPEDAGVYDCVVTGACGTAVTSGRVVQVYCDCAGVDLMRGTPDLFVYPIEQTSPSPSLEDWITNQTGRPILQYDEVPGVNGVTFNRHLVQTFTGIDDSVRGAQLSFRVRGGNPGSGNDRFRLGFATGLGVDAVFDEATSIDFDNEIDSWGPGVTGVVFDDLTSLPQPDGSKLNLLPMLRQRGFLDFIVSNDSGVDFSRLRYAYSTAASSRAAHVLAHPADQTVCAGSTAVFSIAADGTQPLAYQWYRYQSNVWVPVADLPGKISGSHTATLSIYSVDAADQDQYDCLVSNSCRTASSAPALLTVVGFPCSGLVMHHTFDNCVNTDRSGNSNDFTFEGLPSCFPGVFGNALGFDGTNACRIPNDPTLNPTNQISIVCWYRPRDHGNGNNAIVSKGGGPVFQFPFYQYHLGVTGNVSPENGPYGFSFAIHTDGGPNPLGYQVNSSFNIWQPPSPPTVPERWFLLAGTYNGSELKLTVINDAGVADVHAIPAGGLMIDSGQDLYFGRYSNPPPDSRAPGDLDEVRIYNRALTDAEILHLYRSPSGAPITAITAGGVIGVSSTISITSRIPATCESFLWRKDGVPLLNGGRIAGADSLSLTIADLVESDRGHYDCVVTTPCATHVTTAMCLPSCLAEINNDCVVNSQDFFEFLTGFFAGSADFNRDGVTNSQDFFDFIAAFFAGC